MTSKKTIAAFDFDGTITSKDTLIEFIKFSKGKWIFYCGFLLFSPLLVAMKLKLFPNWKAKQMLFSYFYKGTSIEQFDLWGKEFVSVIDTMVQEKALSALDEHKKNADEIVIISASMENWIKPWANNMGINMVLATKIEVDSNNLITGKFLTKNCYGQEKVNRLLEIFPDRNKYILVAYGDSRGDKELLEAADKSFYKFR